MAHPKWNRISDKCSKYSYSETHPNPQTRCLDVITYNKSVDHFRISYSGVFDGCSISFSGTKDEISWDSQTSAARTKNDVTLIRLNVSCDGKNFDYYSLDIKNETRFLFLVSKDTSHSSLLIEDLLNDSGSIYDGTFNRDKIEDGVLLNAIINLGTLGLENLISTPELISQNLLQAATEQAKSAISKKYDSAGSEDIKKMIEYILP